MTLGRHQTGDQVGNAFPNPHGPFEGYQPYGVVVFRLQRFGDRVDRAILLPTSLEAWLAGGERCEPVSDAVNRPYAEVAVGGHAVRTALGG